MDVDALIWQDMFVDRLLSKTEIRADLAGLFGTSPDDVSVVKEIVGGDVPAYGHVICETRIVKAKFMMHLTVYYDQGLCCRRLTMLSLRENYVSDGSASP